MAAARSCSRPAARGYASELPDRRLLQRSCPWIFRVQLERGAPRAVRGGAPPARTVRGQVRAALRVVGGRISAWISDGQGHSLDGTLSVSNFASRVHRGPFASHGSAWSIHPRYFVGRLLPTSTLCSSIRARPTCGHHGKLNSTPVIFYPTDMFARSCAQLRANCAPATDPVSLIRPRDVQTSF